MLKLWLSIYLTFFLSPGFNEIYHDFPFNGTTAAKGIKEKIIRIVNYLKNKYKEANQKISVLSKHQNQKPRKKLETSFIKIRFSHCPLIWMFT